MGVFASNIQQHSPVPPLPENIGELSAKNTTPVKKGYKPLGVMTKDDERFVVHTGPAGGYNYFYKVRALDGSDNTQQSTPTAKHMETLEKF